MGVRRTVQGPNNPSPVVQEKGLPASIETERLVLGSILIDENAYTQAASILQTSDFSVEKHRCIFARMGELREREEAIDRVTVANELIRKNELESIGGLSYLVSLDDGLPHIVNIESYVRIVKEKSALRRTIYSAQGIIDRCILGDRPVDLQVAAEELLVSLGDEQRDGGPQNMLDVIHDLPGGMNEFLGPRKIGLETGYRKLDEMTGGFHPGQYIVLAARPGAGKSALALNIAEYATFKRGKTAMLFSLEMSKIELMHRLVCAHARVDSQRVRLNYLTADERSRLRIAVNELARLPLYVDDRSATTPADMHARIRKQMAKGKVDLVIVDYLQLMVAGKPYESRNQEVTAISRGLKLLAAEISAPVLAISQLSRAPEMRKGNNRPQLSDLRESGCLSGDTLITMVDNGSRVPIASLVGMAGFKVWGYDTEMGVVGPHECTAVFSTGAKPLFEMRTTTGRAIHATANHLFLTSSGWRRVDELSPGDKVATYGHIPIAADHGILWDSIKSISHAGEKECFDMTVPGVKNMEASCFVAHNSIEQDADLVMFIFREEMYRRDDENLQGKAELIVGKQRSGPVGTVKLAFLHGYTKFENAAEDLNEPAPLLKNTRGKEHAAGDK